MADSTVGGVSNAAPPPDPAQTLPQRAPAQALPQPVKMGFWGALANLATAGLQADVAIFSHPGKALDIAKGELTKKAHQVEAVAAHVFQDEDAAKRADAKVKADEAQIRQIAQSTIGKPWF